MIGLGIILIAAGFFNSLLVSRLSELIRGWRFIGPILSALAWVAGAILLLTGLISS